jgi:hypothetical protein
MMLIDAASSDSPGGGGGGGERERDRAVALSLALNGDDSLVPTRQLVKKQSVRTTQEARRKAEMLIRSKRCVD